MIRQTVNGFERLIFFLPAWDRRHEDPKRNFGINGVEIVFGCSNEHGGVSLNLLTNWMLPHNKAELELKGVHAQFPIPGGVHFHRRPTSAYPRVEGACLILHGPCAGGGSMFVLSEKIFTDMIVFGDDKLWTLLEQMVRDEFT